MPKINFKIIMKQIHLFHVLYTNPHTEYTFGKDGRMKVFGRIHIAMLLSVLCCTIVLGYQNAGYQYLSPKPEATHVSRHATVIVRFKSMSPADLANISTFIEVKGEQNGVYTGQTRVATDQKTMIFKPTSLILLSIPRLLRH